MWHSVIEELQDGDALGEGFPIMCDRHPEDSHLISVPGVLPRVSPDGTSFFNMYYSQPEQI